VLPLLGICLGYFMVGLLALIAVGTPTPYLLIMLGLMAAGFGMAFTMPAATTVVEAAPPERAGVAAGAVNAARQVGSTVGVALLGTLGGGGRLAAPMAGAGAAFRIGAVVGGAHLRGASGQVRQGSP
jgi:DHA2 family methylenomycin A resistance protein-like MFS transporter